MAFPTETVYGLGARFSDEEAVAKIFLAKGRPQDNPLIVHVANPSELGLLAKEVPENAGKLIRRFWPGPLTLIFKKRASVPDSVTAGLPTVAVRMPSHPAARRLIREAGEPIAAPSANRSGRPSPTTFTQASKELKGKVDFILPGGNSRYGLESTVVDCSREPFVLLRPGFVTLEAVRKIVPQVRTLARERFDRKAAPSPGLKHRHYRPSCPVILVKPRCWQNRLKGTLKKNRRVAVVSFTQKIPSHPHIVFKKAFRGNLPRLAHELYSLFFRAEAVKAQAVVIESVNKEGLGRAVTDRLLRASGKVYDD